MRFRRLIDCGSVLLRAHASGALEPGDLFVDSDGFVRFLGKQDQLAMHVVDVSPDTINELDDHEEESSGDRPAA